MTHYFLFEKVSISSIPYSLLFNGRSDLVNVVLNTMIQQYQQARDVRYDLAVGQQLVFFSDFVMRFAAEITREVGPPFFTYLIAPNQDAIQIKNPSFSPTWEDKDVRTRIGDWIISLGSR